MSEDRVYWHVPGARSWHAQDPVHLIPVALCGYWSIGRHSADPQRNETVDYLPSKAHLCGSCARVIAARTDVEPAVAPV